MGLLWNVLLSLWMALGVVQQPTPALPPGALRSRVLLQVGAWQGVVWVADTATQRHLGLMEQPGLAQSSQKGMLFLFPPNHTPVFWMKDTPEPLVLLFVKGGRVVSGVYMPACNAGNFCPQYPAPGPVPAAVELTPTGLPPGILTPGTPVSWQPLSPAPFPS